MHVSVLNGKFAIKCNFMENERVQSMPRREYKKKFAMWSCAPTFDNAMHLRKNFRPDELDDAAKELMREVLAAAIPADIKEELPAVVLEGLMPHQQEAIRRAWSDEGFAILHRPRCRKTATTIRLASGRHIAGQIDKLLVFAPNSIKAVWQAEFEKRAVCSYNLHVFESDKKKQYGKWLEAMKSSSLLKVLVVAIEGMSSDGAVQAVTEFLGDTKDRNMVVVDESTRIANHKSNRTKAVWDVGNLAQYRNILTGSEVTRNIENLFSQFRFLGIHVLGFDSFYAWRNRYCLMGGFQKKKIVAAKNADELMGKITAHAHLVKTTDIVNMPDKTYTKRVIKPTPEQVSIIKDIQKKLEAQFVNPVTGEQMEISIHNAMVAQLRAQQVAGGHFPAFDDETEETNMVPLGSNPKLDELLDILVEEPGKVVIWARFVAEIEQIVAAITKKFGPESVVSFYGAVERTERHVRTQRFQTVDEVRYMVANPQAAGMGQEMSAADLMIYYSADFLYESRIQSLERCTNLDKLVGIGVIDLVLDVGADWAIQHSNEEKRDLAEYVENAIHGGTFSLV